MNNLSRFLVAALLLALCSAANAQNVQCYGYARTCLNGETWQNKFITFNTDQTGDVQAVSGTLPETWAATYLDGYVWYVTVTRSLCKAPFNEETQTIGTSETVVAQLEPYNLIIDMAYNPQDGMMYYLCQDSQYYSYLKRSSLSNPSVVETIGMFDVKLWTIAINAEGQAYGVAYEGGNLHRINLNDATTTLVGPTGKEVWYTQSMAFDWGTDVLYWAQFATASDHGLYQVNTQTGAATALGLIGNGTQLTGLFMVSETPTPAVEVIDFETGDFSQFPFNNTFDIPWQIFQEGSGNLCMRSGNREQHSTTSAIEATYNYPEPGFIYFDGKCRGEGTSAPHDKCRFYIDGAMQFEYGATGSVWNSYTFEVTAGTHTFRWEYAKDGNVNPEGDYFAVDNIWFATGSPCMAPTNLVVTTDITDATITWNGNASSYTLRFKLVSESEWVTIPHITDNTYHLTDLVYGEYDLEIQSDCDEGNWTSTTFTVSPPPAVISEIFILGFTAPAWGEHPDYEVEVDPNSPYIITEVEWHQYVDYDDLLLDPNDIYDQEDVNYYLYLLVSPKDGFVFDEHPVVYFDGDNSIFDAGQLTYHDYRIYTIDFQVTEPDGIAEQPSGNISVWPNPANNKLYLEGAEDERVCLFDPAGRLVLEQRYNGNLDISNLAPGIYTITVAGQTLKLVKK